MEYQYTVICQDLKEGIHYEGVFKTAEEADAFRLEKGYYNCRLSGSMGDKEYGIVSVPIDVEAVKRAELEQAKMWLGDYEITGRD